MAGRIIKPPTRPMIRLTLTMEESGQTQLNTENLSGPGPVELHTIAKILSGCLNEILGVIVTAIHKNKGLINTNGPTEETPSNPTS